MWVSNPAAAQAPLYHCFSTPLLGRKQKPSRSAGKLEHMLANITDFLGIVFLTVVRDWNDRKEMSRKHPILSLYKILLVKDTVTTVMMGR